MDSFFGTLVVKALAVAFVLLLLSLAGAITFPVVTALSSVAGVGISNLLLLLLIVIVLALTGHALGRGIQRYQRLDRAFLLAYGSAFASGALLALFGLLNVPYAPALRITWLGTSLVSRAVTLLLVGSLLLIAFLAPTTLES